MTQPKGFEDGTNRVCKLLKSIYGLKQASRIWNEKCVRYLKDMSFEATDDDSCLFYNQDQSIIMTIVVDDGLIIGKERIEVDNVLSKLANRFKMTSECPTQGRIHYIGMDIKIMKNGIFVNQPTYTKKIINDSAMHTRFLHQWSLE